MTSTTEPYACEANLFIRTPDGFEGHIKITGIASIHLAEIVQGASAALAKHGFEPSGRPSSGGSLKAEAQAKAPKRPEGRTSRQRNVTCAHCDGPMWDNRDNKRNPQAPDFKCKDKEGCGAALWIRADGSESWDPPLEED